MSTLTDRTYPAGSFSGSRAYARLGATGERRPVAAPERGSETVTLGKIGDFLELDFGRLFSWLREGMWLAIFLAMVGALAGGAYAVLSPPRYTVSTEILIDPANLQVVNDDLFQQSAQVDNALRSAGSKLRVLTSGNVLLRVVDALNLSADKEFYDPDGGGFSLSSLLPGGDAAPVGDSRLAAMASLASKVSTRADEASYVATLSVSSESTEKAIRISDAMVEAFRQELATAEADSAAQAATALNSRLDELKAEVNSAEQAVEAYRRQNNLAASSGELVNTQLMTQLNTQVSDAQARLTTLQSAYDELVSAGGNATTADTQASAALAGLRATAGSLRQQLDAQSTVLGPRHPTIQRMRSELASAEAEVTAEVGRITAAARASLDEASANLAALTARADQTRASVFSDSAALVNLRELEREATSRAAIYESFLSRAQQVTEREQLDATNVRVISTAVPPPARSWPPRTVLMLLLGAVGGAVLGMLAAVVVGLMADLRQPARRVE